MIIWVIFCSNLNLKQLQYLTWVEFWRIWIRFSIKEEPHIVGIWGTQGYALVRHHWWVQGHSLGTIPKCLWLKQCIGTHSSSFFIIWNNNRIKKVKKSDVNSGGSFVHKSHSQSVFYTCPSPCLHQQWHHNPSQHYDVTNKYNSNTNNLTVGAWIGQKTFSNLHISVWI